MKRDTADGRYLVTVTVNRVSRPMIVSRVSENTFDSQFADQAHIESSYKEKYGGPSGTTGSVSKQKAPVSNGINEHSFVLKDAVIYDIYAYGQKKAGGCINK